MALRPTSKSKRPKRQLARVDPERALTLDEIVRLKTWAHAILADDDAHIAVTRDAAIVLVLLGTAARRFELCAFVVGDYRRNPPTIVFSEAKGNRTAAVAITNETAAVLDKWLAIKREVGESTAKDAPLFCGRPGEFMATRTLHEVWKRSLRTAGVDDSYGVHASRHAAAMALISATKSLLLARDLLRHASITTTEREYGHLLASDLRAGLERAGL
ncbi:MAG: tyrosine-type recombinase/integrase [Kofleriaceae bacterium]|nr:tyrosine-type recombinase/integrase [Kofleriaceae bacterium]